MKLLQNKIVAVHNPEEMCPWSVRVGRLFNFHIGFFFSYGYVKMK